MNVKLKLEKNGVFLKTVFILYFDDQCLVDKYTFEMLVSIKGKNNIFYKHHICLINWKYMNNVYL